MVHKRLYRDTERSSIGGVASGLAEYFDLDVTLFRILFIITAIFGGGVIIYLVMWIVIPPKPIIADINQNAETEYVPPVTPVSNTENPDLIKKRGVMAGLILIGLGIIFLISLFTNLTFWKIWPVLIIVVGAVVVARGITGNKS